MVTKYKYESLLPGMFCMSEPPKFETWNLFQNLSIIDIVKVYVFSASTDWDWHVDGALTSCQKISDCMIAPWLESQSSSCNKD